MIKKYCDRCGQAITSDENGQIDHFIVNDKGAVVGILPTGFDSVMGKKEFCLSCHKIIMDFINKKINVLVVGGEPVSITKPKETIKKRS